MLRGALLLLTILGPAGGTSAAALEAARPADAPELVHVYYPRASCRGDLIELETWSRDERAWLPHPRHARVPVESCQRESRDQLWDELRWRCVDPRAGAVHGRWNVGVDTFGDPARNGCGEAADARVFNEMRVDITSPAVGRRVRGEEPSATIEGEVLLGGRRGVQYDVVIAIDVSSEGGTERVAVQIEAARRFVRHARDRLGDVRIGLVSFPYPGSPAADGSGAVREVALTEDADALEAGIDRVWARVSDPARRVSDAASGGRVDRAAAASDFEAALSFAMAETQLLRLEPHEGARLYSRKLLLIAEDTLSLPRRADATDPALRRSRVLDLAKGARGRGIALHLFSFGAPDGEPSPLIDAMLRFARGSFTRVSETDDATAYLLRFGLPYVSEIAVRNATTGQESDEVSFDERGVFQARVPAAFGRNEVVVYARSSEGETALGRRIFEFDGSLIREKLLAGERARMRRFARKRSVEIRADDGL